ncbi:helix-turn-helix domain-containing protein [Peribacillus simplex]|uniref:helix-turn-helix domain-containing protein n=1 Tax=Peribacillus simplex TaxID=1478 RepID=UPI00333A008D
MEKNLDLPHVLTAKEISSYLKISKSKAYELFKKEGFPVIVIDGNKRVIQSDFYEWVQNQKVGVASDKYSN